MASVAELKTILKFTPIDQPILLIGIHGIGKSEIISQIFKADDYAVITLFLGQMADAGDLIGLPDRTTVDFSYKGKTISQKVTEFCPPKWWPRNSDAKVVVFMDEFNRGKQEVYQCVFDMVLNRRLNGLDLPTNTRIIAAMNPVGDEFDYDVVELDPALIDRFNVYNFIPEPEEWIDWASRNGVHKAVIGFIAKNYQLLDPPKQKKLGEVYPSRRSWKRVSDILNGNPTITGDVMNLKLVIQGIVGMGATPRFAQYIKESFHNLSAGKIVTGWDKETEKKVKEMDNAELIYLNKEIADYLGERNKVIFETVSVKEASSYANNVAKYLHAIPKEIVAEFFDHVNAAQQAGPKTGEEKAWSQNLLEKGEQSITEWFIDIIHGSSEHDKEVDKMINDSEVDPNDHFGGPKQSW